AALLLAGASILFATPATAQIRDLDGAESDVRIFQGEVDSQASVFALTVPANTTLQIDAIARDGFDPLLRVLDASGELIAQDDDGGDNLNARTRIAAEDRSRRVTIEVDSFDAEWAEDEGGYRGSFDLRLSTSDYALPAIRNVGFDARETGTLMGGEHLFTMEGRAGQSVDMALVAIDSDLDPYLELRDESGETIAVDDDGGEGLNALVRHTFTHNGTYTIAASGLGDSEGDYRFRVRQQPQAAARLPLQVIGFDDEASGLLAAMSDEAGDASLVPAHIDYQLSDAAKSAIRAGTGDVSIRMSGNGAGDPDFGGQIDSYLEIGFDTPLGFAVVERDDDGAGDLDALLRVNLGVFADQPGLLDRLRIRAQGYGGTSGAYTLMVTQGN
ncbi:MAG: hypothetical protein WA957_06925, partial [Alteraurantiacibacter sp.]